MAKSKKQRRIEVKDQRSQKKFFTVVIVATLALLLFLYLVFKSSM